MWQYVPVTCTIGIVMVEYFEDKPGELPGSDGIGPENDYSSYGKLLDIAHNTIQDCVLDKGVLGWEQTGMAIIESLLSNLSIPLLHLSRHSCFLRQIFTSISGTRLRPGSQTMKVETLVLGS